MAQRREVTLFRGIIPEQQPWVTRNNRGAAASGADTKMALGLL